MDKKGDRKRKAYTDKMKEKIIKILKKHHLHHYGNFEEAVEELNLLFKDKDKKPIKLKIDKTKCAHNFELKRDVFRCTKCNQTMGQWLITQKQ